MKTKRKPNIIRPNVVDDDNRKLEIYHRKDGKNTVIETIIHRGLGKEQVEELIKKKR